MSPDIKVLSYSNRFLHFGSVTGVIFITLCRISFLRRLRLMHEEPHHIPFGHANGIYTCQNAFEGVAAYSSSGTLLWMNSRLKSILECEADSVSSIESLCKLFFSDNMDTALSQLELTASGEGPDSSGLIRFASGSGKMKWCRYQFALSEERQTCWLHVLDVTPEKEREDQLRFKEHRFRSLFEESKDAISFYSHNERMVNQAWFDMFGYTREELETLDLLVLYDNPDDRIRYEREMEKNGFVRNFEVKLVRKDGTRLDCLSTAFAHRGSDGKFYYQGILRDVTDTKRTLNSLRKNEEQYRSLFECSKDAIILYSESTRRVNHAWSELFGYSHEEVTTLDFAQLFVNSDDWHGFIQEMLKNGFVHDFEMLFRRKDHTEIECLITATVYRADDDAEPPLFQCIIRNVTPMKQMLAALRDSEEKYRHLIENIKEVIYSMDIDGVIKYISPVIETVSGYKPEEIVGRQLADVHFVYPSDLPVLRDAYQQVQAGKSVVHEFRFLAKWGEVVWFSTSVYPDMQNGVLTGFQGIMVDITASVQAKKNLRESEERLHTFLDSATEGFCLFDSYLNLVEINRTAEVAFGLSKASVFGKPLSYFLKEIHFPASTAVFAEVLNTGKPAFLEGLSFGLSFFDFKIFRVGNGIGVIAGDTTEEKNARNALAKAHAELELRVGERTADLNRLNRNLEREISERMRAQETLDRRERELNALLNNLSDIAWLKDTSSRYVLVNRAMAEWIGVSAKEMKGRTDHELWPREIADKYRGDDLLVMRTGKILRMEECIPDRIGGRVMMETIKSSIQDENGVIIGTVGIARDMTDRKRIENALRQSEERLKLAMESSEEGLWDWNIASKSMFLSPRIPAMLGYSPSEFGVSITGMYRRIHPDDRRSTLAAIRAHLRGQTPSCTVEYRICCRDGAWKWVQDNGRVVSRDPKGLPLRMIGTRRDMTERRKTEEFLRESEERYRAIFENAGVALLELDLSEVKEMMDQLKQSGFSCSSDYLALQPEHCLEMYNRIRVSDVNHKTLDIYEAGSKDELLAAMNEFSTEMTPFIVGIAQAIAANETGMQIEFTGTTLRGNTRYVMVNVSIPPYENRFTRVLVSVTDLTERKHFEDALQQAHDNMEAKVRERTQVLALTNKELEREIQERTATENALRVSEERYRTLFETSVDAVGVTDCDFRCIDMNRVWGELFGTIGELWRENSLSAIFVRTEDFESLRTAVLNTGSVRDRNAQLRQKDGSVIDCLVSLTAWRNSEGENNGYQVLIRNITARIRAERLLEQHAEFQQHISTISTNFINLPLEQIDSGINRALQVLVEYVGGDRGLVFEYHDDGEIYSLAHEWCAAGVDSGFLPDQTHQNLWRWNLSRLRRFEIVHVPNVSMLPPEAIAERKSCELSGIKSYISVPMVHGGKLIGVLGIEAVRHEQTWNDESYPLLTLVGEMLVNALERRKIGREVIRYQEKLRTVASELTLAEERERRRIAVDLHDRIGQTLALSKIMLGGIREKVKSSSLGKSIDEVTGFISEAISDTRSLMFEISPPVLYDLGLESALEWLSDQVHQQHGLRAEFSADGVEMMFDDKLSVLLFQFVRELMVNVVKHARATVVRIAVHRKKTEVEIEVSDNGIGYRGDVQDMRPTRDSGYGLFSIRERLDYLGGTFHIESEPGNGTRVIIVVPVRISDEREYY